VLRAGDRARERDDNLLFVRERILRSEADRAGLLDLYSRVHRKQKSVPDDETNPLMSVLHLSGIIRISDGYLAVRNRIYHHVFDKGWIVANMPDAELRRQRAAYRKGIWRAASVAARRNEALRSVTFPIPMRSSRRGPLATPVRCSVSSRDPRKSLFSMIRVSAPCVAVSRPAIPASVGLSPRATTNNAVPTSAGLTELMLTESTT